MEHAFYNALAEIDEGSVLAQLDRKLVELANEVVVHGRKGTLTLSIEIAPAGKGGGQAIDLTAKVSEKLPKSNDPHKIFFVDPTGSALVLNNPNQMQMFPKEKPNHAD